jgi:hypothetical protein
MYCARLDALAAERNQLASALAGLTCISTTMRVRHPAIHWLSRESASVYSLKRHL